MQFSQSHIIEMVDEMLRSRGESPPEQALIKYAQDRTLPTAVLEKMAQVYNTARTLSHLEKSAHSRETPFDVVDVESIVDRYTEWNPETQENRPDPEPEDAFRFSDNWDPYALDLESLPNESQVQSWETEPEPVRKSASHVREDQELQNVEAHFLIEKERLEQSLADRILENPEGPSLVALEKEAGTCLPGVRARMHPNWHERGRPAQSPFHKTALHETVDRIRELEGLHKTASEMRTELKKKAAPDATIDEIEADRASGATTAQDAQKAVRDAQQAARDAQQAARDAQATAQKILLEANEAQQKADKARKQRASDAKQKADTAKLKAQEAQQRAQDAKQKDLDAKRKADDAKKKDEIARDAQRALADVEGLQKARADFARSTSATDPKPETESWQLNKLNLDAGNVIKQVQQDVTSTSQLVKDVVNVLTPRGAPQDKLNQAATFARGEIALNTLLLVDPVISRYDPELMRETFMAVLRRNPDVATDPVLLRNVLRQAGQFAGMDLETATKLQKLKSDAGKKDQKDQKDEN